MKHSTPICSVFRQSWLMLFPSQKEIPVFQIEIKVQNMELHMRYYWAFYETEILWLKLLLLRVR